MSVRGQERTLTHAQPLQNCRGDPVPTIDSLYSGDRPIHTNTFCHPGIWHVIRACLGTASVLDLSLLDAVLETGPEIVRVTFDISSRHLNTAAVQSICPQSTDDLESSRLGVKGLNPPAPPLTAVPDVRALSHLSSLLPPLPALHSTSRTTKRMLICKLDKSFECIMDVNKLACRPQTIAN